MKYIYDSYEVHPYVKFKDGTPDFFYKIITDASKARRMGHKVKWAVYGHIDPKQHNIDHTGETNWLSNYPTRHQARLKQRELSEERKNQDDHGDKKTKKHFRTGVYSNNVL